MGMARGKKKKKEVFVSNQTRSFWGINWGAKRITRITRKWRVQEDLVKTEGRDSRKITGIAQPRWIPARRILGEVCSSNPTIMHCTAVLRAGSWLKPRDLPKVTWSWSGNCDPVLSHILVLDDVRGSQLRLTALGTSGEIKGCLGKDSQSLQPCQFPLLRNLGESAHEMSRPFSSSHLHSVERLLWVHHWEYWDEENRIPAHKPSRREREAHGANTVWKQRLRLGWCGYQLRNPNITSSCQKPGERHGADPPCLPKGNSCEDILISDFLPPALWENKLFVA